MSTSTATTTVTSAHAAVGAHPATGAHPAASHDRWATEADLARFGEAVAEHGLSAYADKLRDLARAACDLAPVAAAVLGDDSEPEPTRVRALAVVTRALARDLQRRANQQQALAPAC